MKEILERQRAAFQRDPVPDLRARRGSLAALADLLHRRQLELVTAVSADFGHRSPQDSILGDIFPTVTGIHHLSKHLRGWMKPERRPVPLHLLPGRAWIEHQPLGVIGVMAPWNYPIGLALVPLATALAAGNRVMIKPSEFTPRTAELMRTMLGELFPEDQVAVVTGDATIGQAFSRLPFDLLCFTGSTSVGKLVMKAASENLVPVILELGGKSPALVDEEYPLEHAARSIAHGKLANAGQTCIAPDYALVASKQADQFILQLQQQINDLYPRWAGNADYSAIASPKHHERLTRLVEDARSRGAKVIQPAESGTPGEGQKFPPTILVNVTDDMLVMQEEIFGPLLPVITYSSFDQAIGYINSHPRPLALYFYGRNAGRQQQVLARTTSGGVTINDTFLHFLNDSLPFGGVGPSGMGSYHGIEGFRHFSHRKPVFQQSNLNFADLLRPPFGPKFDKVIGWLLRR